MLSLLFSDPLVFVIFLVVILASLSFHEFSHALAGKLQGDSTAEGMGRLTLNPMSHVDPIGLLTLVTVGFGWGKPVPFNPYNLRNRRWGATLVAFAGPLSNLVLVALSAAAAKLVLAATTLPPDNALIIFLALMVHINILLFAFNLIPVPPLDGSKFLLDFLRRDPRHARLAFQLETRGPLYLLIFILADSFLLNGLFLGTFFGVVRRAVLGLLGLQGLF